MATDDKNPSLRPRKCPRCGSERVARIIYVNEAGRVKELKQELASLRAVIDRRPRTGNDPRWKCVACRFEWGHPRGPSGSSRGEDELA